MRAEEAVSATKQKILKDSRWPLQCLNPRNAKGQANRIDGTTL